MNLFTVNSHHAFLKRLWAQIDANITNGRKILFPKIKHVHWLLKEVCSFLFSLAKKKNDGTDRYTKRDEVQRYELSSLEIPYKSSLGCQWITWNCCWDLTTTQKWRRKCRPEGNMDKKQRHGDVYVLIGRPKSTWVLYHLWYSKGYVGQIVCNTWAEKWVE